MGRSLTTDRLDDRTRRRCGKGALMPSAFKREPSSELLFEGYKGMEGPAFDREGNLYTVATRQNGLVRWSRSGGHEILVETPPGPNGSTFDRERRNLLVAC